MGPSIWLNTVAVVTNLDPNVAKDQRADSLREQLTSQFKIDTKVPVTFYSKQDEAQFEE